MQQKNRICGLVLAAGLSTRMKAFKPLMPLRGKTILENTIDSVLSGGAQQVVVMTGYQAHRLEPILQAGYGEQVVSVYNPAYATSDMLHSIQLGCQHMPICDAFFLLPGDMPVIRPETFQRVLAQWNAEIPVVFPTLDGYRKHPPLINARIIPEIIAFQELGGLREFWKKYETFIHTVAVDDVGVWVDLDTQEAYQNCKEQYEK